MLREGLDKLEACLIPSRTACSDEAKQEAGEVGAAEGPQNATSQGREKDTNAQANNTLSFHTVLPTSMLLLSATCFPAPTLRNSSIVSRMSSGSPVLIVGAGLAGLARKSALTSHVVMMEL